MHSVTSAATYVMRLSLQLFNFYQGQVSFIQGHFVLVVLRCLKHNCVHHGNQNSFVGMLEYG